MKYHLPCLVNIVFECPQRGMLWIEITDLKSAATLLTINLASYTYQSQNEYYIIAPSKTFWLAVLFAPKYQINRFGKNVQKLSVQVILRSTAWQLVDGTPNFSLLCTIIHCKPYSYFQFQHKINKIYFHFCVISTSSVIKFFSKIL